MSPMLPLLPNKQNMSCWAKAHRLLTTITNLCTVMVIMSGTRATASPARCEPFAVDTSNIDDIAGGYDAFLKAQEIAQEVVSVHKDLQAFLTEKHNLQARMNYSSITLMTKDIEFKHAEATTSLKVLNKKINGDKDRENAIQSRINEAMQQRNRDLEEMNEFALILNYHNRGDPRTIFSKKSLQAIDEVIAKIERESSAMLVSPQHQTPTSKLMKKYHRVLTACEEERRVEKKEMLETRNMLISALVGGKTPPAIRKQLEDKVAILDQLNEEIEKKKAQRERSRNTVESLQKQLRSAKKAASHVRSCKEAQLPIFWLTVIEQIGAEAVEDASATTPSSVSDTLESAIQGMKTALRKMREAQKDLGQSAEILKRQLRLVGHIGGAAAAASAQSHKAGWNDRRPMRHIYEALRTGVQNCQIFQCRNHE